MDFKNDPEIVETIKLCKKNEKWLKMGQLISASRRKRPVFNLCEIDKKAKEGEVLIIPGKVLSQGDINKKIKIVALKFSEETKEKLKNKKIDFSLINEEIKKNPNAKDIRILT